VLKTVLKEKDHWRDLYFELVDQEISQNAKVKTEKLVKVKTEKLKEEKVMKKRDLKLKVKTEL
jgi:hypothetical protein